jgi:hypothetical protein
VTLIAQWDESAHVIFNLYVEGMVDANGQPDLISSATVIARGESVNSAGKELNLDNLDELSLFLTNSPFNSINWDIPYDFDGWSNIDNLTLDSSLNEYETIFTSRLVLKRYTVTFVDPQVNLFGQTVEVPWGSTLLEPELHRRDYDPPAGYNVLGWHTGITNSEEEALAQINVDAYSEATLRIMPGHAGDSGRDDLATRNITNPIGIMNNLDLGRLSNVLSRMTTSVTISEGAQLFIFDGNEESGKLGLANANIITDDTVLTRVNTLEDDTSNPDTNNPDNNNPKTNNPGNNGNPSSTNNNIPITGGYILFIVIVLLGMVLLLRIKRRSI